MATASPMYFALLLFLPLSLFLCSCMRVRFNLAAPFSPGIRCIFFSARELLSSLLQFSVWLASAVGRGLENGFGRTHCIPSQGYDMLHLQMLLQERGI